MSENMGKAGRTVDQAEEKKTRFIVIATSVVALSMSVFHIWTTAFGVLDFISQRGLHLAFAVTLMVLRVPLRKNIFKNGRSVPRPAALACAAIDLLIVLGIWVAVFAARHEYMMKIHSAGASSMLGTVAGFILCVISLEFARRTVGWMLPMLAVISIVYALAGPYLPHLLSHRGYSLTRIFAFIGTNADGIFGMCLSVSATVIFMFILFGAFLEGSQASKFVNDAAMSMTGRLKSGPALAAVLASALMGTINGSAVANVVATGTFTIPLMKKKGYSSDFAGGVESVASTGGQILPPVMGSGAFIMVAFTEIPYSEIIIAAALPAALYFLGAAVAVILNAERIGLKALTSEERRGNKVRLQDGVVYAIPIGILVYTLLGLKMTPTFAALISTVSIPLVMLFDHRKRYRLRDIPQSLATAAKGSVSVVSACACAGIVVSMVAMTGIGVVFGDIMISLSGGNLLLALVFTAMACIVLGMGLPTTASYVIAASILAPTLIRLGVPVLSAHLFVFYYACLAAITPPVALAAYAAAGISQGSPFKTAAEACKIGFAGFIIPFMFVYNSVLLAQGSTLEIIYSFITAFLGIISMSAGFQGALLIRSKPHESFLLLIGGLGMVAPEVYSDIIGIVIVGLVMVMQLARRKTSLQSPANC